MSRLKQRSIESKTEKIVDEPVSTIIKTKQEEAIVEAQPKMTKKKSNLSISKKTTAKPSVPIRFDLTEHGIIKEVIEELEENYTNLNRTDVVRAAVRMLKKANKKVLEQAIDSARMGKTV